MDKQSSNIKDLVGLVRDGDTIIVGGFGACGTPITLINALAETDIKGLKLVANNCGTDDYGLGRLLVNDQLERITASYIGDNSVVAQKYASGEVELELVPQGTLAERMRAGGAGIAAFFTRAGVGTMVADGGMPWKYGANGAVVLESPKRRTEEFDGETYVMECAVRGDFALVHAAKGDRHGNLVFAKSAQNFNPLAAMAGRVTIAEVEELVEPGELSPEEIHLPGIFVQHVFELPENMKKRVDRLTLRDRAEEWGVML
ncbi:CoA transferase subunit A [Pacificibacter marinus]|uniref:CoA transferase subunit A n=1 Tax=Pacificibacter marinus TaxID=658057 RepID=UPI001C074BAE|nr:CoA transferase subunit A [Pacificibacter marinus]MBU2867437.1 CoA transferase subunit A [Pacificibacter marinus]